MRIGYLAKHDSGGNDDEGAIYFALEKLGHSVKRLREVRSNHAHMLNDCDFLLCHHLHDLSCLEMVTIPKVFWSFDLIEWDDSLRHKQRVRWIQELTERCDLGFCSDGDWVAKDITGKLHWLTQGADERELPVKAGCLDLPKTTDILFVGGIGYGRDKFVQELKERYGERFKHILKGCHGAALANEINRAKTVVAPDSPVTDRYWSNRVYNVLRLGGFLIHPMSSGLQDQLEWHGWWYRGREAFFEMIDDWIPRDESRETLTREHQDYILSKHTYTHRCQELLKVVQKKLL